MKNRPHPLPGATGGGRGRAQLFAFLAAALVLFFFTVSIKLPHQPLLLENEIEQLLERHHLLPTGFGCDCLTQRGPEGAPRYCRLGLPLNDTAGGSSSSSSSSEGVVASQSSDAGGTRGGGQEQGAEEQPGSGQQLGEQQAGAQSEQQQQQQQQPGQQQVQQQEHRLAVLIPYRDRVQHLTALLAALRPYLDRQGRAHDIFVLEQADELLFNRGALLNAAALLLQGSTYDYYVFQDVDTVPLDKGDIQYSFPKGAAPLHLTPHWVHPKSTYIDFFGGLLIVTAAQFRRINGFGTQFWGWGREDDNLRERLVQAGMWPPEYPDVPREATWSNKRHYFLHQKHKQAEELRAAPGATGETLFFQENPRLPYKGAKIMSSQPQFLKDFSTGLNSTMFSILSIQPFLNATKFSLRLHCNATATPWCHPAAITERQAPAVRHAAAVHAVSGS